MIPFPSNEIQDEDGALDWWEKHFAPSCESLGAQVNAAMLVRNLVASLRQIRGAALEATLTYTEAATETGYSSKQISRWVKAGKIQNVESPTSPRALRRDIVAHKKTLRLPSPPPLAIVATAQDIARSVANQSSRSGDG